MSNIPSVSSKTFVAEAIQAQGATPPLSQSDKTNDNILAPPTSKPARKLDVLA